MKLKTFLTGLALALSSAAGAFAQTTIADWTFDVTQPTTTGPYSPEVGSGAASASGVTIAISGGNPSSGKSYSGSHWVAGSYWQFQVSTLGLQGIGISFDQEGSATGPSQFTVQYSTDGVNFTPFGDVFSLGSKATTWMNHAADLSSITALNNIAAVYIRVVDASGTAINGSAVGTSGTDRIDNVIVTASGFVTVAGKPTIFTSPQSTNVTVGRTVVLGVAASGSDPLGYQWYYPNLSTPLTDNGSVSGSSSASLTLNNVTADEAGGYQVVVSNLSGSVTSSVATLTVITPVATTIGHLRTLQDSVNWTPTDTTTLFTVQGTVTTVVNETKIGNAEFFIQDDTGGISVFIAGGTGVPDPGTVVQVTGPLGQFDGLLEMNLSAANPNHSVVTMGSDVLPAPQPFSLSSLSDIPFTEATEGSLIVVSNVFLSSTNGSFVGGAAVTLTNLSGQVFTLFINANNTDIIGQSIPPFAASITGILGQFQSTAPYTSGYELDMTQAADLVAGTPRVPGATPIPLNFQMSGGTMVLTWADPSFVLQSSTNATGPYTAVDGATSGFTADTTASSQVFFRLMHP